MGCILWRILTQDKDLFQQLTPSQSLLKHLNKRGNPHNSYTTLTQKQNTKTDLSVIKRLGSCGL